MNHVAANHFEHKKIVVPSPVSARSSMLLQIMPIRSCNLRCKHCFITNQHKKIKDIMSLPLFKKSLDITLEFSKHLPLSALEFDVMGGEIHTLPDDYFAEMAKYACDRTIQHAIEAVETGGYTDRPLEDVAINFMSNYINVSPEKLDMFLEAHDYFEAQWAKVDKAISSQITARFFLHSSWEPDTNRFYKDKVFDQWAANFKRMSDRGARIGLCVTGTRGTIATPVEDLFDMAINKIGAAEVAFDYFGEHGEGKVNDDLVPDYDETIEWLTKFVKVGKSAGEKAGKSDFVVPHMTPGATLEQMHSRPLSQVTVDYDGTVALESVSAADKQFFKEGVFNIASGTPEDVISRLIQDTQRGINGDFRQMMNVGCLDCRHVEYCQGGYRHYVGRFTEPGQCAGFKQLLDRFM
ncbi:hypothetical protein [Thalassospira xiamenensis]|uniref:Sulfatase maturation enzyme AslB, radical SAM superfamily n=1 Tax=Thalassospira xiamenensis TaxID=220697 RepID=A0A285TTL7_9PROT|nr:hypothetical protein [Thalassospira xiamenensis]SOC27103.1 Sulfatase maturation enzyme AslB, radical SAM superfamily [Thalassospira xiamenensis]